MTYARTAFRFGPLFDTLEPRRLFAVDYGPSLDAMRLPEALATFAQRIGTGGAGQTIAVIDSGIDYNHPALSGGFGTGFKVVGGYDFVDDDADPMDTFGHGTEVAGVIAADAFEADNLTFRGIAPEANLLALRIDGDGATSVPDERIERALQWVIDHSTTFNITAINISYGTGDFNTPTVSTVYGDELRQIFDLGITVCASSGNRGVTDEQGIDSPAADPTVISVGSVNAAGVISDFTERGPVLKMLAVGESVYSTLRNGGFGIVEGTSFSTPAVTATVALMKQIDPTLKPADVMSILRSSGAPDFDGDAEAEPNTQLTFPTLNIFAALQTTLLRSPGTTQEQADVGRFGNASGVAIDSQNVTHFVYYDSAANTLKYATRSVSGVWSNVSTIDTSKQFQGYYLSLALDNLGRASVAYFDGTDGDLKFARLSQSAWDVQTIDVKNSTGLYPSLAYDSDGRAVIAYYRKTTGDLRVAAEQSDGRFAITAVDTDGDVGRYASVAIDKTGRVGIAYEYSTRGHLKFASRDPLTQAWTTANIDRRTRGVSFISLAFDPRTNRPAISYYDAAPADLKVATFARRTWSIDRVASRGATGLFTNAFFAGASELRVVYWDKRRNTTVLALRQGGIWSTQNIGDARGRFASVAVAPSAGVFRFAAYVPTDQTMRVDSEELV